MLVAPERHVTQAAVLLREQFLLDMLRTRCRAWFEGPRDEKAHLPHGAVHALGLAGEVADAELLHAWFKARPADSYWIGWATRDLVPRHGVHGFLPLLADLLRDGRPEGAEGNAQRLLNFDKKLPAPTAGDQFLVSLLVQFKRSPAEFGFKSAPERLLAERLTVSVEDRDRMELAVMNPQPSDWLFFSTMDRARGVDQAIAWLMEMPKLR
jgi:hypothetical protein